MLKEKVNRLINEYGVKRQAIIKQIDSNRVTFQKKLEDNSFTPEDERRIKQKWGKLL